MSFVIAATLGPATFRLKPNTATFGYVVGSAKNGLSVVSVSLKTRRGHGWW